MADVLGISEGAVRVRIHRIKQKLSQWQVGVVMATFDACEEQWLQRRTRIFW